VKDTTKRSHVTKLGKYKTAQKAVLIMFFVHTADITHITAGTEYVKLQSLFFE